MNQRWSLWHSVLGLVLVIGAVVGLWAILHHPSATSSAPTALERKGERLDELCRMIDTDIRIGQTWSTDPTGGPKTQPTLEVLGQLATICHWDDTHPEAP